MDNSRLRMFGEALGVAAVVGSLVFVGLEIRQNAAATRAAAVQSVFSVWNQFHTELGADPAVWEAVGRVTALEDHTEANPADLHVAQSLVRAMFTAFVNTHYHFEEGLIDAGIWGPQQQSLERILLGSPSDGFTRLVLHFLEIQREEVPVRFRVVVDSILMQREGN